MWSSVNVNVNWTCFAPFCHGATIMGRSVTCWHWQQDTGDTDLFTGGQSGQLFKFGVCLLNASAECVFCWVPHRNLHSAALAGVNSNLSIIYSFRLVDYTVWRHWWKFVDRISHWNGQSRLRNVAKAIGNRLEKIGNDFFNHRGTVEYSWDSPTATSGDNGIGYEKKIQGTNKS